MNPIASQERLKALGLEQTQYGSCSEPEQRSIKNVGKVWINRGCDEHWRCQWKTGLELMDAEAGPGENPNQKDDVPRPRNVVVKLIKPNPTGPGDRIINNYCACYQAIRKMRRDGKNREIVEVVSGEGSEVRLKGSERHEKPDKSVFYVPIVVATKVPRFPDPTEVADLFEDVYAGRDRLAHKEKTTDAERAKRLSGAAEKEEALEQVPILSGSYKPKEG